MRLRISIRGCVRPSPVIFECQIWLFLRAKSSNDIVNNSTMSDDELVTSNVPPRYLLSFHDLLISCSCSNFLFYALSFSCSFYVIVVYFATNWETSCCPPFTIYRFVMPHVSSIALSFSVQDRVLGTSWPRLNLRESSSINVERISGGEGEVSRGERLRCGALWFNTLWCCWIILLSFEISSWFFVALMLCQSAFQQEIFKVLDDANQPSQPTSRKPLMMDNFYKICLIRLKFDVQVVLLPYITLRNYDEVCPSFCRSARPAQIQTYWKNFKLL